MSQIIEVLETGTRTVVGFREMNTWDFHFLAHCEDELDDLVRESHFEVLAFDLTNVLQMSSTLLGILIALYKSGFKIELFHVAKHVRSVLKTSGFERLIREPGDDTA